MISLFDLFDVSWLKVLSLSTSYWEIFIRLLNCAAVLVAVNVVFAEVVGAVDIVGAVEVVGAAYLSSGAKVK